MALRLYSVLLLLVAAFVGCSDVVGVDENESVVVFVLDSPVNVNFLEGRVVGLSASDVTHGSLVGRVLRSYCRAPLMCVTAEGLDGRPDRSAYLSGLRSVLDHLRQHPDAKVVVNISLAFPAPGAEEEELIRRITAAGALVVAAAGNEDSAALMYPAAYPGVVAVASATRDGKVLNSNFGPHINIAASGDISFIDYEFLPYERLRREMEARGTSFAAPRVAATAAYLMRHDPRLSPREAYRILESTAGPVNGAHYRDGMLGAGLLDIYRAKCVVSPTYRFVHFVLPVSIWIVLGVISAYLCVRHGWVGAFLTLMIWLVGLPASILMVLKLAGYLEFVGGGSVVIGLAVSSIFAAAMAIGSAVQHWNAPKTGLAVLPAFAVFLVLSAAGVVRHVGQMTGALAVAAGGVGVAVALEVLTRRKLRSVMALPDAPDVSGVSDLLVRTYRRTLDARVERAVLVSLARVADATAVEFLLHEKKYRQECVDGLTEIARTRVSALAPWLQRLGSLEAQEEERLREALVEGGQVLEES